jgi:hypothetical protein
VLSRRSFGLLTLALTLCVGATALFLSGRNDPLTAILPADTAERSPERIPADPVEPVIFLSEGRRGVGEVQAAAPTAPPGQASPTEPVRLGSIIGSVLDVNGKPLADKYVAFYGPGDLAVAPSKKGRTDADGYYAIDAIATGRWRAFYLGDGSGEEASLLESGEVEVLENQTATWDFAVIGNRRLKGAFPVSQEALKALGAAKGGGIELQLVLRSRWSPDTVVARAFADTDLRDDRVWDPEKNDVSNKKPRGVGRFEMSSLEPGQYVLRVRLPGRARDSETGESIDLYVERDVDLFEGDVELPREKLTIQAFVDESFARRRGTR